MACISPCPRIGLSTYMVCRGGTSKPVSHMSRTITTLKGSLAFLNRFPNASLRRLSFGCVAAQSARRPPSRSLQPSVPRHHWPRCANPAAASPICWYSSTQMRRLIHTIIALPSIASSRASKCPTRSSAIVFSRFLRSDNGLQRCPLGTKPLASLDFFAFGYLFKAWVDLRSLAFVQLQLG